jgi:hypothetical protein
MAVIVLLLSVHILKRPMVVVEAGFQPIYIRKPDKMAVLAVVVHGRVHLRVLPQREAELTPHSMVMLVDRAIQTIMAVALVVVLGGLAEHIRVGLVVLVALVIHGRLIAQHTAGAAAVVAVTLVAPVALEVQAVAATAKPEILGTVMLVQQTQAVVVAVLVRMVATVGHSNIMAAMVGLAL